MRLHTPFLALALGVTGPAQAGVHATYKIGDEEKPLIVDVADNGDASFMQPEGDVRVVVIDHHAYIVADGDDGVEAIRLLDMAKAVQTTGTPKLDFDKDLKGTVAKIVDIRASLAGTRAVAGVDGSVYRLTAGKGVTLEGPTELVATKATELRPIGRAVEIILAEGSGVITLFDEVGPDIARWMRILSSLVALGTPLRWEGLYELRAIETKRIPPETIALPGEPVSPEGLIERIRAMSPGV